MTVHRLKIDTEPYNALSSGAKTCEVRNNDRNFKVGDSVILIENNGYRKATRTITHIQTGYGLPDNLCVLSYGILIV